MSIPLICKNCGDLIGEESTQHTLGRVLAGGAGSFDSMVSVSCPGKGKHRKPEVSKSKKLFGLISKICVYYPETDTVSTYEEYAGSNNKFLLWVAIIFGTRRRGNGEHEGVLVNGKWVWWNADLGFYGDGLAELPNL